MFSNKNFPIKQRDLLDLQAFRVGLKRVHCIASFHNFLWALSILLYLWRNFLKLQDLFHYWATSFCNMNGLGGMMMSCTICQDHALILKVKLLCTFFGNLFHFFLRSKIPLAIFAGIVRCLLRMWLKSFHLTSLWYLIAYRD